MTKATIPTDDILQLTPICHLMPSLIAQRCGPSPDCQVECVPSHIVLFLPGILQQETTPCDTRSLSGHVFGSNVM